MPKKKRTELDIRNEVTTTRISVREEVWETLPPGGGTRYPQFYMVLTIRGEDIWMLPGEARELVKMLRA